MSGEGELYYGIVIMGLCIPPFVHYALKFIRKDRPRVRWSLAAAKAATRADLERAKKLLKGGS